jgi:hypothetical protein
MAAKAGERARETGDFRCDKCHNQARHCWQGDPEVSEVRQ